MAWLGACELALLELRVNIAILAWGASSTPPAYRLISSGRYGYEIGEEVGELGEAADGCGRGPLPAARRAN